MSQVGIEVQELAECGEYQSVEVVHALDSGCGGVLQLRQVSKLFRQSRSSLCLCICICICICICLCLCGRDLQLRQVSKLL